MSPTAPIGTTSMRGPDRRTGRLRGDARTRQNLGLAGRGRAAMGAHRRHYERLAAGRAQLAHDGPHRRQQAVDAPAADGHRDPRARGWIDAPSRAAATRGPPRARHVDGRRHSEHLVHPPYSRQVELAAVQRAHDRRDGHRIVTTSWSESTSSMSPSRICSKSSGAQRTSGTPTTTALATRTVSNSATTTAAGAVPALDSW